MAQVKYTHLVEGVIVENIIRKDRNVLVNDTLNTFYLWLYGKGTFKWATLSE